MLSLQFLWLVEIRSSSINIIKQPKSSKASAYLLLHGQKVLKVIYQTTVLMKLIYRVTSLVYLDHEDTSWGGPILQTCGCSSVSIRAVWIHWKYNIGMVNVIYFKFAFIGGKSKWIHVTEVLGITNFKKFEPVTA